MQKMPHPTWVRRFFTEARTMGALLQKRPHTPAKTLKKEK